MKCRLISSALGACLAVAMLAPAGAMAASEFGDSCTANNTTGKTQITLFGLNSPSSAMPLAAPSAGVITAWKLSLVTPPPPSKPIPTIIPQTLKVMRLDTAAKTARAIGESSGIVGSGLNTVATRIPVQAGDRLALFGSGTITFEGSESEIGTLFCGEGIAGPSDLYGGFPGSVAVGGTAAYEEGAGARVPAVAVLEPDVDNDGFGDETQDACPQSAALQSACPPVTLSTSKQVRKGSVLIVVATDTAAPVTVSGVVKLGKGKKAKLSGGTKNLTAGTLGKFTLKFSKRVKAKLARLSPKQRLTLKATVTGTSVAGAVTEKTLKVKLKGQAKR